MPGRKVIKVVLRRATRGKCARAARRGHARGDTTSRAFLTPPLMLRLHWCLHAAQDTLIIPRVRCGDGGRPWAALKGGKVANLSIFTYRSNFLPTLPVGLMHKTRPFTNSGVSMQICTYVKLVAVYTINTNVTTK